MEKNEARNLVEKELERRFKNSDLGVVILDEHTREEDFGWVFFYQSKQYMETGNRLFMLVGNAPFIVDKSDGSIHVMGTAHSIDRYIQNYRATGEPNGTSNNSLARILPCLLGIVQSDPFRFWR